MTVSHDSVNIGDRIHSVRLDEICNVVYKDDRSIVIEPLKAKTDPRVQSYHILHSQGCYYGIQSWREFVDAERMMDDLNKIKSNTSRRRI
jgi:hypothetical protein